MTYFMTFLDNGDYAFQPSHITEPCRIPLDWFDLFIFDESCDMCGFPLENDDPNGWACDCEDTDDTGGTA